MAGAILLQDIVDDNFYSAGNIWYDYAVGTWVIIIYNNNDFIAAHSYSENYIYKYLGIYLQCS